MPSTLDLEEGGGDNYDSDPSSGRCSRASVVCVCIFGSIFILFGPVLLGQFDW